MRFLSIIFKPKEVRDTIFALNSLAPAFEECMGYRDVESAVRRLIIKHPDRTKHALILDRREPLELALLLIRNHCIRELSGGQNHIYRGRLSMNGMMVRAIYDTATRTMVERGYMSADEAAEEEKGLAANIAEVG
jgi:hypothetical protein